MRFATTFLILFLALGATLAEAQYGVEFTAPDTFKAVRPDSTANFPVHIKNIGTVTDIFRIDFTRRSLPPNWILLFCDDDLCYEPPFNITLGPGDTFPKHPHISIIAYRDLGTGWGECQVRSLGDTTKHVEIRFWCRNNTGVEAREGNRGTGAQGLRVAPNPFSSYAAVLGREGESFALYDIAGRKVGLFRGDRIGEALPPGIYFLSPVGQKGKPCRILKVR